ncbi:MAG: hypothetical protein ABIS36_23065 [Chryseolinea sp.]
MTFLPRQKYFSTAWLMCALTFGACQKATRHSSSENVEVVNPNGRNDQWGFIGFGGGGATFYPVVSPHDPNNAFLSCDMTGSYHTNNGGDTWRMFNLRTVVGSYVFDPLQASTVYALGRGDGGGLYKSTNGGDTWSLRFPKRETVSAIVAKGDHADERWITKDSTRHHVMALAVDPANSSSLYAVIQIQDSISFQHSSDGGENWAKEKSIEGSVTNIFVHPGSDEKNRTIYLTRPKSIISRTDGRWNSYPIPTGVDHITEYGGGFDSDSKRVIIYGISGKSYFNPEGDESGIFMTDNGGASWSNKQNALIDMTAKATSLPEWRSLGTSSKHPNVLYISYANFQTAKDTTCIGVAKSVDFGNTWSLVWKDKMTSGNNIPAKNLEGGWINDRYGPSWGENPFSIGVSPGNADVCYTTDFGRVLKTVNGGRTWDQVYTKEASNSGWTSRGIEVTSNYNIVYDPFDFNHVFIANTDVGLMESQDRTKSWKSATKNTGIPRQWMNSTYWLAFDPLVQGRAWAAMSGTHDLPRPKMWRKTGIAKFTGGIAETNDGGKTWTPLTSVLGETAMTHILIEPSSAPASRTLYACAFGKGVYRSLDGGKTWSLKNKGIEGKEPFAWRIIRRETDGNLFLIVCRRSEDGSIGNELDGALYRSTDGAESWTKISLPKETNAPMCVVTDPEHPSAIILSAWGRNVKKIFSADIGGGIFYSDDDGKTWNAVLDKDQHIHDVTYDPRTKTFFACGFAGSAYKSADGQNWDRIMGFNFKWGRRVEPDMADSSKVFVLTFGGGVWYGPAAGDPDAAEDIINPLPVF